MNLIPPLVESRVIVVPPKLIEFPDRYRSRHRKLADPRSYTSFEDGTIAPATSSFACGCVVPMPTFNVPGCMKRDVIGVVMRPKGFTTYYKKVRKFK